MYIYAAPESHALHPGMFPAFIHASFSPCPSMPEFRNLRGEEDRLALTLSSIRCKLNNELTPIASLPPEILEQIFDICVSWLYGYQKPKHRLGWTQVCQSWRRISLSSSRLWHRIDLCDARLADEFLLRSKQTPLSLVTPCCSPLKLTTDKLSIHAYRLRSIDVFLPPDEMVQLFRSVGPNLWSLASLSLKIPPMSSTLSLSIPIPFVRRLNLDGVSVPWETCQNLTSLSLRGINKEYAPSVSELYHIFINSPRLRSIRLEGFTPPTPPTPEVPSSLEPELIHLPYLADLTISSDAHTLTALLSRLSLNLNTRLQLHVSLSDDLHTLFPRSGLPHAPNNPHMIPIQTIRLSQYSAHFLRTGAHPWSSNPTHTIFALSSAALVGLTRTSRSLVRLCNPHKITQLELNTGVLHDVPMSLLSTLFSCLNNLEALYVAFHSELETLFTALRSIDPSTALPYLPTLRRMGFSRPGDIWWHFATRWMRDLVEMLRWRKDRVGALESVCFWRCGGVFDGLAEVREMQGEGLVRGVVGVLEGGRKC